MAADQALKILVKTEADTSGIEQVNTKLKEVGTTAASSAEGAAALGAAIGTGIGGVAITAIYGAIIAWKDFEAEEQRVFDEMERGRETVLRLQEALLGTADAMRQMALIRAMPLEQGIVAATQEVIKLKTEQSLLNLSTEDGIKAYKEYQTQIQAATSLKDSLVKGQERERDAVKATQDQIALSNAAGNEELTIQMRVQQAYDQKLKSLLAARVPETEAKQLAIETAESERNRLESIRGQAAPQREFNTLLKDTQTILQGIRQQQQLISSAPFMGADAKQAALLRAQQVELQAVQSRLTEIRTQNASGVLDPNALARNNQELQRLDFTAKKLQQDIAAGQKPLQAELQAWANSFGSTMHQLGQTIEQTVGVALQGLNQWLVTGKFNAQAMLQQIEMLGLQLIEQLILQRVMSAINSAAATGQAAVTGPAIAAAFAPAATAVTVATEGQAALTAPASFAIALAAIQAMAVAHSGGRIGSLRKRHSGGLGSDEEMIIAQQGEFMVQRDVAQQPGMMDFLSTLNAGTFHGGGLIKRMHRGGEDFNWSMGGIEPFALNQAVEAMVSVIGDPEARQARIDRMTQTAQDIQERSYDYGSGLGRFMNYSFNPPSWTPGFAQGPTMIPSQFDLQGYPIAQQAGTSAWQPTVTKQRPFDFPDIKEKHRGGLIGSVRVPRYHSGGMTGGGRISSGNVNVHNYTDLKALVKEMSTRKGRNIIVDTVRGHRIDLGMR